MKSKNYFKKEARYFIGIFIILLLINFISANFVCGKVYDSDDNISASWYKVNISYANFENKSTCQISPSENKYCCDIESIIGRTWKAGDIVYSEIKDNESGYVAGPVSVTTTSDGYNILPEMKLEPVIQVNSFIDKLIISNSSKILLNANFKNPYNKIEMEINGNNSLLCGSCSAINQYVNTDYGINKLRLSAINGNEIFSKYISFNIIHFFDINESFSCPTCKNERLKQDKEVNVSIFLNLSNEVDSLELKEYVPIDWEILDSNGGKIKSYSESHNLIIWNISGKENKIEFRIKSPKIGLIFNEKYSFITELENNIINEKNITVYWFLPFFSNINKKLFSNVNSKGFTRITPENPLVSYPKDANVMKVAIFPKKEMKNIVFSIKNQKPFNELDNSINYYLIDSNIEDSDIEKIYVEFKVSKDTIKNKGYGDIGLFRFFNSSWEEGKTEILSEDKDFYYYGTTIEPCEIFSIAGDTSQNIFQKAYSSIKSFIGL